MVSTGIVAAGIARVVRVAIISLTIAVIVINSLVVPGVIAGSAVPKTINNFGTTLISSLINSRKGITTAISRGIHRLVTTIEGEVAGEGIKRRTNLVTKATMISAKLLLVKTINLFRCVERVGKIIPPICASL